MELKAGYKQTEAGVIPEDWDAKPLQDDILLLSGRHVLAHQCNVHGDGVPYLTGPSDFPDGTIKQTKFTNNPTTLCQDGDILVTVKGSGSGTIIVADSSYCISRQLMSIRVKEWDAKFLFHSLLQNASQIKAASTGTIPGLSRSDILYQMIPLPPNISEQRAIAATLNDVDALITALDRLIAKKCDIKQAAMQELLTGKRRLPGFSGQWMLQTLKELTDCIDNLRVPLNDVQRMEMKGDYPYCGANGVLDYVDNYVVDDDIILIAEDGGYFDEYQYRPIAYRMTGKCWVNNHAHILKAKQGIDQDFIYYSLVHKNILRFLTSGTRAKLNKSEMYKIEIQLPVTKAEQTAISAILSDMDVEIAVLENRREKTRTLKQGVMQELLTGRIRLVQGVEA